MRRFRHRWLASTIIASTLVAPASGLAIAGAWDSTASTLSSARSADDDPTDPAPDTTAATETTEAAVACPDDTTSTTEPLDESCVTTTAPEDTSTTLDESTTTVEETTSTVEETTTTVEETTSTVEETTSTTEVPLPTTTEVDGPSDSGPDEAPASDPDPEPDTSVATPQALPQIQARSAGTPEPVSAPLLATADSTAATTVLAAAAAYAPRAPLNPNRVRAISGNEVVNLSWDPPADNGGPPTLTYRVQVSLNGSSGWQTFAWLRASQRSLRVTNVRNGVRYYYRVIAVNEFGASTPSWWAVATPSASSPHVPWNPNQVRAVAGSEVIVASWNPPVDNGTGPVLSYRVQRSSNPSSGWVTVAWVPASQRTVRLSGLRNGSPYYIRVIAVNESGAGRPSWWATATPSGNSPHVPGFPWGLRATSGDGRMTVTWNTPADPGSGPVLTYRVQISTTGNSGWRTVQWLPATPRTATITGLRNGLRYFVRVIAVNTYGPGAPSWWAYTTVGGGTTPPPPVTPGNCPAPANTPGGADPWGGCWPGPHNTGVPSGVTLAPYTGPCTITASNVVIDSRLVECTLTIRGANVRIQNSRIVGSIRSDGGSVTVVDSEVIRTSFPGQGATVIGNENFTLIRVEAVGGNRSVFCDGPCTIVDSWVHGQIIIDDAHGSGIRMSQDGVFRHNSITCDANQTANGGCSAGLTGYGDFEPVTNNLIERNLFVSGSATMCAYGGASGDTGGKPYGADSAMIRFVDNVFQRRSNGECGNLGTVRSFDPTRPGNVFTGNRWSDGSPMLSPD